MQPTVAQPTAEPPDVTFLSIRRNIVATPRSAAVMPSVPALSRILRPQRSTRESASAVTGIGTSHTMRLAALAEVCESPAFMNMGIEKYWMALKPIA